MPKANALPTTHRRTLFTGAMAASIMSVLGASARASAAQDATLIKTCAEFQQNRTKIEAVESEPPTEFGSEEDNQRAITLDYLVMKEEELLDRISEMSASTQKGILAKAGVIRKYLPQYVDEFEAAPESSPIKIVLGLMDDILASTKGAQV